MRSIATILIFSILLFCCKEGKPKEDKNVIVNDTALALKLNDYNWEYTLSLKPSHTIVLIVLQMLIIKSSLLLL